MSELRSALPDAVFDGAVRIEEAGPRGMITLKGDLASSEVKNAATGVAGLDFPGQGEANCVGEKGLCWMAPDELLILVPRADVEDALSKIAATLSGTPHLAADVSDARALFLVSGAGVRDVLAKLTPADLRPGAFPTGRMRRTRLAQVPAAFWMRDAQTFEVICFRSVAGYVFDLLSNAARPGSLPDHF